MKKLFTSSISCHSACSLRSGADNIPMTIHQALVYVKKKKWSIANSGLAKKKRYSQSRKILINVHYFAALDRAQNTITTRVNKTAALCHSPSKEWLACVAHTSGVFIFCRGWEESDSEEFPSTRLSLYCRLGQSFLRSQSDALLVFHRNFMAFSVSCENLFEKQSYMCVCVCSIGLCSADLFTTEKLQSRFSSRLITLPVAAAW